MCYALIIRTLCLFFPSPDACYLARHVALKVGAPVKSPALTLNRLCGSGFEAVIQVSSSFENHD